jgi:hypothetical protein
VENSQIAWGVRSSRGIRQYHAFCKTSIVTCSGWSKARSIAGGPRATSTGVEGSSYSMTASRSSIWLLPL